MATDLASTRPSPPATTMRRAGSVATDDSTFALVRSAISDATELASAELALAKMQLRETRRELVRRLPLAVAGGTMTLLAAVFGMIGLSRLFERLLVPWAGPLVAATIAGIVGAIALVAGRPRKHDDDEPR